MIAFTQLSYWTLTGFARTCGIESYSGDRHVAVKGTFGKTERGARIRNPSPHLYIFCGKQGLPTFFPYLPFCVLF